MKPAVVVPCLDEERTIARVLEGVREHAPGGAPLLIVVDDGSTDRTAEIAASLGATVVSHGVNRGVGAAFHSGLDRALRLGAEVVVNIDGDGQFDPAGIPLLVGPIVRGEADFVSASRFADPALVPRMPAVKRWGNRRIAGLLSRLLGQRFFDVSCGFRAYSREAALSLNLMGQFTYTHETFLDLAFKGFRILEVPLRVRGEREFGTSRVAGSVLRYAANSGKIILRTYRDYRPFSFFGVISGASFLFGASLLGFLLLHRVRAGTFFPHIWAGFVGGGFVFNALVFLVIATLADMLDRIRFTQERILGSLRRMELDPAGRSRGGDSAERSGREEGA